MSNTKWKPMPDHPGYLINRSGWVKNERGYVVANGKAVQLKIGGVRVRLSSKQLLEIAGKLFARRVEARPKIEVVEQVALEPREPVYLDDEDPDEGLVIKRTCRVCGKKHNMKKMVGRMCSDCAAAPPPPKKSGRRCRSCGKELDAGYWYRCSICWRGRSSTEDSIGVAL